MEIHTEQFFVITRMSVAQLLFYCQKNGIVWLPEAEEAIRFCREVDAERIMQAIGGEGLQCDVMEGHEKSAVLSEPSGHTNQAQFCGQFNEPIPTMVYWDESVEQFRSMFSGMKMRPDFQAIWKDRCCEFPTKPI